MFDFKASYIVALLQMRSFALTATTPLLPMSLTNDLNSNPNPNATLPSNITLATPSNALPPDPWNYNIPSETNKQVQFFDYGRPLNAVGISLVIHEAFTDAGLHAPTDLVGLQPRRYREALSGDFVYLYFYPTPSTMWKDVAATAAAIVDFTMSWDRVELAFDVDYVGRPRSMALGTGLLSGEKV